MFLARHPDPPAGYEYLYYIDGQIVTDVFGVPYYVKVG